LAAAASMSGCAVDQSIPQRATAIAVGGNAVAPVQVKISDERTVLESFGQSFHWHASAPNGEFDCSAISGEGVLIQTVCVKK
jgi:hypothetical protein